MKFCRAAMMEFEINMSEMPLGKLSKSNIQKGTHQNNVVYFQCSNVQVQYSSFFHK